MVLRRRKDYIESSGAHPLPFNFTIPLNRGAADTPLNATSQIIIPHVSLVATPFTDGGGEIRTISTGKFQGRKAGGGARIHIYGSARYGSGYGVYNKKEWGWTYSVETGLNVSGRDLFFGYPPFHWGDSYSGGKEYSEIPNEDMPGMALIDDPYRAYPGPQYPNQYGYLMAKKGDQSWITVADAATINILWDVLLLPEDKGGCGVDRDRSRRGSPASGIKFTLACFKRQSRYILGTLSSTIVLALSFLANSTYDNKFAHVASLNNTDYWAASPLNTTGVDLDFLKCLNTTIAAALPMVDPTLVVRSRLSPGQIAGVAIGSIIGGILLIGLAVWLFIRHRRARPKKGKGIPEIPSSQNSVHELMNA
ncbi:SubName: Full=Uncharacterized protein {ECO:0000313/EMBL:CCA68114.1} [Serendipita indica DSM 11827]|nr:SubName: Full=Uncharacterized protein {ECO:0000313/EMBL:CCA68114.1} [Serendipita indica DSM 11827]